MTRKPVKHSADWDDRYNSILGDIADLAEAARRSAARSINSIMTAAYWLIGRRIVECEQKGEIRAEYGEELLMRLSSDLRLRYGRGFSRQNLQQMRQFYLLYPSQQICQTLSGKSEGSLNTLICQTPSGILQTASAELSLGDLAGNFPLPWSSYVRLFAVKNEQARRFYEAEALRGGWSVRQLDRQINSQFYERTALSRNKAAMLCKGAKALASDRLAPEEEIKDPLVLEFLDLKDEYSETDLEEALILHLESFLLELGGVFCNSQCDTHPVEVVPRRLGGPVGIHNLVHACSRCAASKSDKDLFAWWCNDLGHDKDELPRIPAGLFLKMAHERHTVAFALKQHCDDIRDIWSGGSV